MIEIAWLRVIASTIIVLFMIMSFIVTKFNSKTTKRMMLVLTIILAIDFFALLFIAIAGIHCTTWIWISYAHVAYAHMTLATLALLLFIIFRKEYLGKLKEQLQLSKRNSEQGR